MTLPRQLAVPVGSRNASIHKEIAPDDEAAVGPHQERGDGRDLVRRAGPPCLLHMPGGANHVAFIPVATNECFGPL